MRRRIAILGATGSIGKSTLDLIERSPDQFELTGVSAATNVEALAAIVRRTGAGLAVIADESRLGDLRAALAGTNCRAAAGGEGLIELATGDADLLIAAIVGCAGLRPVMAAVEAGKTVALANKEALVTAGALMTDAASRHGATLLPIDSEHNAIFQCLAGSSPQDVSRLILTASGGPFRTCSAEAIAAATPAQAVAHPNWSMGAKISVDSATLMNKGLELIEAHYLFGLPSDQIDIVIHPQSVIHSLVEFIDGSVLAQLGSPDMRIPIAYALAWPDRMATPAQRLDLASIARLDFEVELDDSAVAAVGLRKVLGADDGCRAPDHVTRLRDGRQGRRGYPPRVAAPVRKGDEVEVRIDTLAYGGNGVGRLDGFVVFVRGGLPGDLVRARATKVKKGFAEATRTALLEPGPDRVDAPCRHFGVCGGCRFQDLAYESQLDAKHAQVRDALVRLGGFADPPLEPIVPARSVYGYRNKLEYSFAHGDEGLVLGFHRAGRWDEVIDVEECLLTTDTGNAIREAVKGWARAEALEPYDQESQTGYLRHLVVREGRNTGQVLVLLVTAPGERFDADFLIETLTQFPAVRSVHWAVNDRPAEVTNLPTRLLWGNPWIEEELLGLRFRIRPNAFLQTNTEMAETLYTLAREAAGLTGSGTVYDLYCGTGTIGLALAADAESVWGVEISEESVACAIENAEANGISNARFFAGNVGQSVEELAERAGPPDVVVVDPPRAGLAGKALRRTGALCAPRIVYVSCNPTTLASDLAVLRDEYGYELVRCTPVDMFPHTPHIESVSLLRRAPSSAEEHDAGDAVE